MNYVDEAIENLNTLIDEVKFLRECKEENALLNLRVGYLERAIKAIGATDEVEALVNRYIEKDLEDIPF